MVNNELVLLDQALAEVKAAREEPLADDIVFELFAAEQILKDYDLSPEEIESGRVGGSQDGAIDAVYVVLGDSLVTEDAHVLNDDATPASFQRDQRLVLWIIQGKTSTSFAETPIDLLSSSLGRLLVRVQLESSACLDRRGSVGVTGFRGVQGRAAASVV